jgi:hypothetical protein
VTTALFTSLVYILHNERKTQEDALSPSYRYLFWLNQVASFGMLISFICQGYGPVSIFFSALSVLFSYWFAYRYWKDSRHTAWPASLRTSVRLALVFLVLSSAGPYLLAYSMSHAVTNNAFYYNAIYLFLHFQYNGWFTFAILALFFWAAFKFRLPLDEKKNKNFVILMGVACVPAYGLSLLWTDPPAWIWILSGLAAVIQLIALSIFFFNGWIRKKPGNQQTPAIRPFAALRQSSRLVSTLWLLSFLSFGIKIKLQAFSVIPYLGRLAFGFRPVIIAYLHLVLLGFAALFLMGFFIATGLVRVSTQTARVGLSCFIAGVFANEFILLTQSLLAFASYSWKDCPYYLIGAALLMFGGLGLLLSGILRPSPSSSQDPQRIDQQAAANHGEYPEIPGHA